MTKILILLSLASTLSAQTILKIDTFYSAHSPYPEVLSGVLDLKYFFLSEGDFPLKENFNRNNTQYFGFHRAKLPTIQTNKYIYGEEILEMIIDKPYSFLFPIGSYKIKKQDLWEKGFKVVAKGNQKLKTFRNINPIIVNFYCDHKAIYYEEFDSLNIDGVNLFNIYSKNKFDRMEIIVSNNFDDYIKIEFYLQN